MDFRLKIIQIEIFFISWSLTKLLDFGLASTKTDTPISIDLRDKRKSENSFSPFFRSLSLFSFSPPSFCLLPSHFLIFSFLIFLLLLSFFFFSFIFYSISFSSFSLFYFSFRLHQPNGPKVGETSPHFSPLPLVITTIFLLIS